ncbi:MAG: FAD-binding protein [bacterium]
MQAYLAGRQYIVNTASLDGRHCVTDIWADHRLPQRGASNIYHGSDLLPSTGEVEDALTAYVGQALDALGVRHGPAHSEVMMTAAGPVLIETAARLQGGLLDAPLAMALDRTQMAMAEACYTDRALRRARRGALPPARPTSAASARSPTAGGIVRAVPRLELAGELPPLRRRRRLARPGARVVPPSTSSPPRASPTFATPSATRSSATTTASGPWRPRASSSSSRIPMQRRDIPGMTGPLVGPDDPSYATACLGFNGATRHTELMRAAPPEDVAAVVQWAREAGKSLHLRSSGHCVAGHSSGDGVVLDLSRLTGVRLQGDVAHVGAATTFATLTAALRGTGWHLPVGLCDSVCVAGYAGRHGLTSRTVRMMCDRAVGFTVMLADRSIVRADLTRARRPVLGPARRGRGHLGVVLANLRMARLDAVWAFAHLEWSADDALAALDLVQRRC